jgi:hypothetical protein
VGRRWLGKLAKERNRHATDQRRSPQALLLREDLSLTKGQSLKNANFREDMNARGAIDMRATRQVKKNLGHQLP